MSEIPRLHHPWLVAAWPGMGNVGLNAVVYMLARLKMRFLAEVETGDLFDVDGVEVREGLIHPGRRPRNRYFLWQDPAGGHDLVLLLGEAQPPLGKYAFCRQLITQAREYGVERVVTFAAMATGMHPQHRSRVYGAATSPEGVAELRRMELEILEDGQIGGLNGVLLGVAAETQLRGVCLLGEMPQILIRLSFPKASLAILQAFSALTGIEIDLEELSVQADAMDRQLGQLLARVEPSEGAPSATEEEDFSPQSSEDDAVSPADRRMIERLFEQTARDRSRAFELKQVLDRLGVFTEYEDRFLDLFKPRD